FAQAIVFRAVVPVPPGCKAFLAVNLSISSRSQYLFKEWFFVERRITVGARNAFSPQGFEKLCATGTAESVLVIAEHVQMVRVPRATFVLLCRYDAGNGTEMFGQVRGIFFARPRLLFYAGHLFQQQSGLEFGHPKISATVRIIETSTSAAATVVVKGIA